MAFNQVQESINSQVLSSDSESEVDGSSSESMSISERLFDKQEYDDADSMNKGRLKSISIMVPALVSMMTMDKKRPHGGSVPGRRYIKRDRHERHNLIVNDYFRGKDSKYSEEHFRRRFRMDVELFLRILHEIEKYDDYFTLKVDAFGRYGLSPIQKMVAVVRMFAYGCPVDLVDEYVQIGESNSSNIFVMQLPTRLSQSTNFVAQ